MGGKNTVVMRGRGGKSFFQENDISEGKNRVVFEKEVF